ncbi:MAG: thiamine pyrophosphate-binding protein [Hyphomicrobiaceae bacterium]
MPDATQPLKTRSGGHILIDQLAIHGADTIFGVPGESYLEALDGLHGHNKIKFVTCRQEGGAAMMAEAYGKVTGRPGICFVTRGPGATNASSGVHVGFQDSTPMILLVGQVGRDMVEREAFQEIDYRRMFGQMAKWVAEIDDARRIPEMVSRAFFTATSGRPGPVVLALPEDMLTDFVETADAGPYHRVPIQPGAADMARLGDMLAAAERPVAILGGSGWSEAARKDFEAFAVAHNLPVAASFRCQDMFDNGHPNYVGHAGVGINPKLGAYIKESDLLLVVGARLGEMTTQGYTLIDIPRPKQKLVHVYPDPNEIGRTYQPDLAIVASCDAFAAATRAMKPTGSSRAPRVAQGHAELVAYSKPTKSPGGVQMSEIVAWLRERLPADAIVTNGAGNYATWLHRFWQYRGFKTGLAPTCGSMGYGVPAAVAAKSVYPERTVVAFAGDGCFMMTSQEFMTAVQHNLPIVVIVSNNGMYGTIRMHQEREHPNRISGTELKNPDFAALARACGGFGARVDKTEQFAAAFEEALGSGKPALIELTIDPEALSPATTLSGFRAQGLAKH